LATMAKKDYYEVLGVSRQSSAEEIKKAFRSRARNLHPDNKHSGDEAAFKLLAEAYEVLSDENKRSLYDRYGHDGVKGAASGFDNVDFGAFAGFGIDDLIDAFFGGGLRSSSRRGGPEQGNHLKISLKIEFLEGVFGADKKISVKRLEDCETCSGSGAQAGTEVSICTTCGGMGQVQQIVNSWFGQSVRVMECPSCGASGRKIEKPCRSCNGQGLIRKTREFELKIPAGVESGSRLRVAACGDKGKRGGPFGDLFVVLQVAEHEHFVRQGDTIHLEQPISFSLAALGGQILVPTVNGPKPVKIVAGTQTDATIVLKEMGVPRLDSRSASRGDQIVHLIVKTPTKLNQQQKKLFEKLAELNEESLSLKEQDSESTKAENDSGKTESESHNDDASFFNKIVDAFKPKSGVS
jgi:molecular chaperone DnaJ